MAREYDLVVLGATIVDGTGAAPMRATSAPSATASPRRGARRWGHTHS